LQDLQLIQKEFHKSLYRNEERKILVIMWPFKSTQTHCWTHFPWISCMARLWLYRQVQHKDIVLVILHGKQG